MAMKSTTGIHRFAEDVIDGFIEFFYNAATTIFMIWRRPLRAPLRFASSRNTEWLPVSSTVILFLGCLLLASGPITSIEQLKEFLPQLAGLAWYQKLFAAVVLYMILDAFARLFSRVLTRTQRHYRRDIVRLRYGIAGSVMIVVVTLATARLFSQLPSLFHAPVIASLSALMIYPAVIVLGSMLQTRLKIRHWFVVGVAYAGAALCVSGASVVAGRTTSQVYHLVGNALKPQERRLNPVQDVVRIAGLACTISREGAILVSALLRNQRNRPVLFASDEFRVTIGKSDSGGDNLKTHEAEAVRVSADGTPFLIEANTTKLLNLRAAVDLGQIGFTPRQITHCSIERVHDRRIDDSNARLTWMDARIRVVGDGSSNDEQ